jgi:hypothetical protein
MMMMTMTTILISIGPISPVFFLVKDNKLKDVFFFSLLSSLVKNIIHLISISNHFCCCNHGSNNKLVSAIIKFYLHFCGYLKRKW